MRKISGPTRTDDGYWRIKTNQEINDILKGQNIIGFIKKQRLNWLGHVVNDFVKEFGFMFFFNFGDL